MNERISRFRQDANITQEEMAKQLGISIKQYLKIEKTGEITCEMAKKISEVLSINILKILYNNFEYKALQKKPWFIKMINEYTAPHIFIHDDNKFMNDIFAYNNDSK